MKNYKHKEYSSAFKIQLNETDSLSVQATNAQKELNRIFDEVLKDFQDEIKGHVTGTQPKSELDKIIDQVVKEIKNG